MLNEYSWSCKNVGREESIRQRGQMTCVKFKDEDSRAPSEKCIENFSKNGWSTAYKSTVPRNGTREVVRTKH